MDVQPVTIEGQPVEKTPAPSAYEVSLAVDPINVTPPAVKQPYVPANALDDLPAISHGMRLFLASHMVESEDFCEAGDPLKNRLYMTSGYGIIQCVKGMMSFEDEDILAALNHVKQGNIVAQAHRKRTPSFTSRLTGYAWGASANGFVRSMTDVERHAELVYAETLFEKALLGIMYSGDWLAFVKEALNMRTTINIYHQLLNYVDEMDAEALARYETWVATQPTPPMAADVAPPVDPVVDVPAPPPVPVIVPETIPEVPEVPTTPVVLHVETQPVVFNRSPSKASKFPKLFRAPKSPTFGHFLGVGHGKHSQPVVPPSPTITSAVSMSPPSANPAPPPIMVSSTPEVATLETADTSSIDGVDDIVPPSVPAPVPAPTTPAPMPYDTSIDNHFRSGVYLGVGLSSIVLSLMPGKLASVAELFGYRGDRRKGLSLLARAGGWEEEGTWKGEKGWKASADGGEPGVAFEDEGIRRTICDMALVIFHLVLSSFTFDAVDISMADKVLNWNIRRYPSGVFFLFGAGRLSICRSQPKKAIEFYTKAMEVQTQYRNLHHISFWEIALATLSLWDVPQSLSCWKVLQEEATWSKAMYAYGHALCLIQLGGEEQLKEAAALMDQVQPLRRRIAGKSIPIEKFVARKARKFQAQGGRLALPFLELAYIYLAISHAPREIIIGKMLPEVEIALAKLKASEASPATYGDGKGGYWDDLTLAMFLKGVCLRFVAYPDADAVPDPAEVFDEAYSKAAAKDAVACFESVFTHGPKIELDHHVVYHAHYEFGRLLACQGDLDGAKKQFELIISGKPLEVNAAGRKGKYSLENALNMRTHAAMDALEQKRL